MHGVGRILEAGDRRLEGEFEGLKLFLHQTISPFAQELEDSHIAKYLQLLPDFVANMRVVAMQLREVVSFRIDIRQHKIGLVKRPDYGKNVQGPASTLYG
jgi:hypothetical protein